MNVVRHINKSALHTYLFVQLNNEDMTVSIYNVSYFLVILFVTTLFCLPLNKFLPLSRHLTVCDADHDKCEVMHVQCSRESYETLLMKHYLWMRHTCITVCITLAQSIISRTSGQV